MAIYVGIDPGKTGGPLQVGVEAICECGQEQYKGRWRAPKTMTGLVLRGRWTA